MADSILIGADPEIFVTYTPDKETMVVPVEGLLGGTKEEPLNLEGGVLCQEDNVMAEFNIKPTSTAEEFVTMINLGLSKIRERLKESDKGFDILIKPSHVFQDHLLESPQAKMFGCMPDMCAYTENFNHPVSAKKASGLRTCSGHVHIGYENPTEERNYLIAKILDIYLGLPFLFIDSDTERRKLYGKAGALRHKPYGLEYRTLSNHWLTDSYLMEFVFNSAVKAVNDSLSRGEELSNLFYQVQKAINNNELTVATTLMSVANVKFPEKARV